MTKSAAELQKSIFAALGGDAALTSLLGAGKIHDLAPGHVAFPYITFGRTSVFDWSTGTESGDEHLFTLHVWSTAKGKKETLAIMERAKTLLHDAPLELVGYHLVSLRLEFSEVRFDEDASVHHGLMRFRALIEVAG
ncbi:DUF3168 domain-containing protein [Mesorhizobium sp. LHD-90]|uniref:DUF3168 domain-containing protein n=1 Tax=Mesorhizobium sp. LHD-90 TaxID=3071414 RepID=UPI0027E10CAD|nr:DUF3168 domain-containing protein [Mesorhizobium sp. LHD-90]MDQ6436885.1 DUF3168 domain-containing protein [Mesorhizobium sp. LHD-90]